MAEFRINSDFTPQGDQPQAIDVLVKGVNHGDEYQTLLGVTGSGKTFTMANVIQAVQKPTLIMSHNKTLAAQLYGEFKQLFPNNAVEFFISYYDYYQPEAYLPVTDTFIEKDMSVNEEIDKLRLKTTSSLMAREDVIVISSVSCIYGIGSPEEYNKGCVRASTGEQLDRRKFLSLLINIHYSRNDKVLERGNVRVRALRINYMGELGWELHHPMKQMESLYDAIYEVGKKDNIANFGTYAVNSLRMEKAYRGWGAELTGEISLVEAGMDRFFNLNKKSNFIGSEVLREKLQSGVDIKIVYLEIDVDDADARGNEPVYHNNKIVGVVTSGAYGFRVNKSLAFAYVQAELAKDETELLVEIQGQKRKAKILNAPAYDPENKKLKS